MGKQLYINNELVDMYGHESMPLNKSIADIRDPENRSSAYTKTIVVPGTKNNNKLFGFIFDVAQSVMNQSGTDNFFPDFNPNLKASCRIYDDTILQIEGYAQLLQINIVEAGIEYEISVVGQLGDLYSTMGSNKLGDLDLSQYNHTLSRVNVVNSWATSIKDSTGGGGNRAFEYGVGYVYPAIDYGENTQIKGGVFPNNFRPAVYVKTIIDKIFSAAGYSYTTDSYFNSDLFKHLIIPYTGTGFGLTDAEVASRYIEVNSNNLGVVLNIGDTYIYSTEVQDTYNQYNTATGELTVTKGGYYITGVTFEVLANGFPGGSVYDFRMHLYINGVAVHGVSVNAVGGAAGTIYSSVTASIVFADTDVVEFRLKEVYNVTTSTLVTGATVTIRSFLNYSADKSKIPSGGSVIMNDVLPPEILQRDFLTSIIRMFNLYVVDTGVSNQLIIKTRDAYLTDNINDYRGKLDISQKIEISPMGELDANPYYWTYKPSTDYYNGIYTAEFNRTYGDFKYFISNDFISNEKKFEVIFAPSVMVNEPAWSTDMVAASYVNYDGNGNLIEKGGDIRILYYGGLKHTDNYFEIIDAGLVYTFPDYPYAGHLDDPYASTIDICFGTPQKVYFPGYAGGTLTLTGNNLFETFYREFISEITSKDSKLLRAWFRLRAKDIFQMDFSYLYYFMGQYFRLNKLIDHEIGIEGTTQMEFLKSKIRLQEGPPVPPPPAPTYTSDFAAAIFANEGIVLSAGIVAALEAFEDECTTAQIFDYNNPSINIPNHIHVFVGGAAASHKYNFLDPRDLDAAYRGTFAGGITHNANGVTGNGTNGYMNAHWKPNTNGQNDIHVAWYCKTANSDATFEIGCADAGPIYLEIAMNYAGSTVYYYYTNSTTAMALTNGALDSSGIWVVDRSASNSTKFDRNGGNLVDNTTASSGAPSTDSYFMAINDGGAILNSDRNYAFFSQGKSLGNTKRAAYETAIANLQTALGR